MSLASIKAFRNAKICFFVSYLAKFATRILPVPGYRLLKNGVTPITVQVFSEKDPLKRRIREFLEGGIYLYTPMRDLPRYGAIWGYDYTF